MSRKLTVRQERFIEEYLATGNGAEAARRAGYTPANAKQQAIENLSKPYLKDAIDQKRKEMSEETQDRREKWISRLEQLGLGAEREADRLRAIEQLFKAEGWLAPEKTEQTVFDGAWLADLDDSPGEHDESEAIPDNVSQIKGLE